MRTEKAATPTPRPSPTDEADAGLKFDRLPAGIRRLQRFGSEDAARHAEAVALRREIDAVAGRLAAWVAAAQGAGGPSHSETPHGETPHGETPQGETPQGETPQGPISHDGLPNGAQDGAGRDAVLQLTWVHLRRAGLALRAEIDRHENRHEIGQHEISRQEISPPEEGQLPGR